MIEISSIETIIKKLFEESIERKFLESVDLAINLKNIDLNQPKNRIDIEMILPHGIGKEIKIGVFAKGDIGLQAKNAGAAYVFSDDDITKMIEDKIYTKSIVEKCDIFISETQYMQKIGKSLGTILGPRGKMPIPLLPNKSIVDMITSKKNSIRIRSKEKMTFHVSIGKRTMPIKDLAENTVAVIDKIEKSLIKGKHNLKSIYITTTMGSSIKVI